METNMYSPIMLGYKYMIMLQPNGASKTKTLSPGWYSSNTKLNALKEY
jgi:hypothetical protein